jgi:hypothetical protein
MVAIAILAMAIFGIFHAYSVGFMGMADARDRTVATNYAREAMEDVKNMDFEKMTTTTKSVINANKKYRVDINVSQESINLKNVSTVVSWKNRNGITKTVETSMLVHFIEVFALEAAKIVLFTDSYSILNSTEIAEYEKYVSTELTAVIKDIKGNTIIDWGEEPDEGNIYFSIISEDKFGTFSNGLTSIEVIPINGRANTTFTSNESMSGNFGINVIEASVYLPDAGKTVTDTTTIKITNGPVKIKLEPNPEIIKASTTNYSTITASLIDAAGKILRKKDIFTDVEITFSVFGEGNLSTSTITIPFLSGDESDASTEIILNSTGTPGLASVVATATDLESGKTDVRFLGPPIAISLSANPNPMYFDDAYSTITVSLLDINGFNTNPTDGPITISLAFTFNDTGGSFEGLSSWNFPVSNSEGIIKETKFSGQSSTGTATITATASEVGLPVAFVTINVISKLVPDHIKLTASSKSVLAGEGDTSTIRAVVYDKTGKIITNYSGTIIFSTDFGTFSIDPPEVYTTNGVAEIKLSSDSSCTANIEASLLYNSNLIKSLEAAVVEFYGGADHIALTANPEYVKVNGINTSTITATVCDLNNLPVSNYSGTIIFSTDFGTFSVDPPEVDTTNGMATIDISYGIAETVIVVATDFLDSSITGSVEVIFYEETTLELITDSVHYFPADLEVEFAVVAIGEDILVDEMGISWEPNAATEKFHKIVINSDEVYTGNKLSGKIVDILDKTLVTGESYIVKLTFGEDVGGKVFVVIFYPYTGSYPIYFTLTTP